MNPEEKVQQDLHIPSHAAGSNLISQANPENALHLPVLRIACPPNMHIHRAAITHAYIETAL